MMTDDQVRALMRRQMKTRRLTQRDYAADLGVPQSTLSQMLSGQKDFTDGLLEALQLVREVRYRRKDTP